MFLFLLQYDITICYYPGKEMSLADALSQLPNLQWKSEITLDLQMTT